MLDYLKSINGEETEYFGKKFMRLEDLNTKLIGGDINYDTDEDDYKEKYIKYKTKYLNLKIENLKL